MGWGCATPHTLVPWCGTDPPVPPSVSRDLPPAPRAREASHAERSQEVPAPNPGTAPGWFSAAGDATSQGKRRRERGPPAGHAIESPCANV